MPPKRELTPTHFERFHRARLRGRCGICFEEPTRDSPNLFNIHTPEERGGAWEAQHAEVCVRCLQLVYEHGCPVCRQLPAGGGFGRQARARRERGAGGVVDVGRRRTPMPRMGRQEELLPMVDHPRRPGGGPLDMEGLRVRVLSSGVGHRHPRPNTMCRIHYEVRLERDGALVDSSARSGNSISVTPNQVIPGLKRTLLQMVPGDAWEVEIPPHLAYGEAGRPPLIPPRATLFFTVGLLAIE